MKTLAKVVENIVAFILSVLFAVSMIATFLILLVFFCGPIGLQVIIAFAAHLSG